jgi:hypothetical protein
MRCLNRLLAAAVLALPLIAAGTLPAFAGDRQGGDGQGQNTQGGRGAPEIDSGLLGGVVTLLTGVLLILRERRRG